MLERYEGGGGGSSRGQWSPMPPISVLGPQSWTLVPICVAPGRGPGAIVAGAEAGSGTQSAHTILHPQPLHTAQASKAASKDPAARIGPA